MTVLKLEYSSILASTQCQALSQNGSGVTGNVLTIEKISLCQQALSRGMAICSLPLKIEEQKNSFLKFGLSGMIMLKSEYSSILMSTRYQALSQNGSGVTGNVLTIE